MDMSDGNIFQTIRAPSGQPSDRVQKPPPPGTSSAGVAGSGLNPRSCVTCRRRKVKCDKRQPCSNCTKAHIECIFPSPGRAPRKARKPPDTEMLARLRRLEGVVQSLGAHIDDDVVEKDTRDKGGTSIVPTREKGGTSIVTSGSKVTHVGNSNLVNGSGDVSTRKLEQEFGRLVFDEGRSRYINSSHWANLSNEVEDLKGILHESTDDGDESVSPPAGRSPSGRSNTSSNHQEFIFGFSSQLVDTGTLHPPTEQIPTYWLLYKENVDPLVKVLHIPTMEGTILDTKDRLERVPKGLEALLFAIYYSVATSLTTEECLERFGEERSTLLTRYRFAVEQGLARANFLVTEEMVVLQAFVIFLICLRRNEDARVIWTLTGLVVRIAQTLGIHRDGSNFGLSPFESEMRRRLWWQVCVLDIRTSEDHGCDPIIVEQSFDTRMPLNVFDTDLDPNMMDSPKERIGCTQMTFCLIRYELSSTFRSINYQPPARQRQGFAGTSLEEKEKWINDCHERLEDRYLKHCDMTVPLYWVTATVARLMLSKMWLMVYHPFQRLNGGADLPQETKDRLFGTSLESVEYSVLLETESRTTKWSWLFRTYVQWHAMAFLLSELCVRTKGEEVERAWRAVNTTFSRWGEVAGDSKKSHLWKPLRKLMATARAARDREMVVDGEIANPSSYAVTHSRFRWDQKRLSSGSITPINGINGIPPPAVNGVAIGAPLSTPVNASSARVAIQNAANQRPPYIGPDPASFNRTSIAQLHRLANTSFRRPPPSQAPAPSQQPPVQATQHQHSGSHSLTPQQQQPGTQTPKHTLQQQPGTHTPQHRLQQQQPFLQSSIPDLGSPSAVNINEWLLKDGNLSPRGFGDDPVNWEGWDDMVKDFQMEIDQAGAVGSQEGVAGTVRGPAFGGTGTWW